MPSRKALTKLQTILIIDVIIIAFATAGYFYVTSKPGPELSSKEVQLADLKADPFQIVVGNSVRVFVNATNIGKQQGIYTINMTVDGTPSQQISITLSTGETKVVELTILNAVEGTHTVKIGELQTTFMVISKFSLTDLAINRTDAKIGEPIGITVRVTNLANQAENYSLSLSVNNVTAQTRTGQLDAAASRNVLFEVVEKEEGIYQFQIGSLNGSFKINPAAPPPKPAEFQVANLTIDPEIAEAGKPVNVTARVTNIGEISGNYSVSLAVNGEVKGNKNGQLAGGETVLVAFTVTENVIGNYTISFGNATGTLSIQPPSTIKVTGYIIRPYEVWAGQTVTLTVKANNTGSEASSLPLKLKIDNVLVETKILTLAAQSDGSIDFTIIAPPLPEGKNSFIHVIDMNGTVGGFMVVKDGYHTLSVQIQPNGDAEFTLTLPNGQTEQHKTFWSALLPDATYTVTMPQTDPTGRISFQAWDDGSTNLARTISLTKATTITATYTGGSSCPSLYMWNGTSYVYVTDVSNHGWLGYINYLNEDGSITYYRNNPWDYVPLNSSQLQSTNGSFNLILMQKWNEIFYLDQAYMMVVDHPANVSVYSTMVEQYLDPNYMGKIYTISKVPLTPVSAVNEKGENVLPQISKIDGVFTSGGNGIQSPAWNNITWNKISLNLGNLTGAQQIKLVVKAIANWGSADDYTTWLNKFFVQPVPNGTEVTPPAYMEVKDANGNWVRIPQSRDFPLPPDGDVRTYVIDLTGLFPSNDYSLRINNFWNVTFDFIGVDTSSQQNITIQKIDPQAYLYPAFAAGTAAASGNLTQYGNVTQLILNEDDMFVIGRQGDAVSLKFPITNLTAPAPGMVRDYFLYEATWFKDENGNWGFGYGFTVDPLPFQNMSGFPYLQNESYPNDTAHQNYLQQWNTRIINESSAKQLTAAVQNDFPTFAITGVILAVAATYTTFRIVPRHSFDKKKSARR